MHIKVSQLIITKPSNHDIFSAIDSLNLKQLHCVNHVYLFFNSSSYIGAIGLSLYLNIQ